MCVWGRGLCERNSYVQKDRTAIDVWNVEGGRDRGGSTALSCALTGWCEPRGRWLRYVDSSSSCCQGRWWGGGGSAPRQRVDSRFDEMMEEGQGREEDGYIYIALVMMVSVSVLLISE